MAKDFVKLSEVTMLEEVTDNASVLVEMDGEIYRAPKTQVGGAGGVKTAIIRDSGYLNAIAGVSTMIGVPEPEYTYECINMTFEEAYEIMQNGESLSAVGQITGEGAMNGQGMVAFLGTAMEVPCIVIVFDFANIVLYWTADGLSTSSPQEK